MEIGLVLSNLGIFISFSLGMAAVFKPSMIQNFVGLQAVSPEGQTEIRATYGGFFIGLSVYAFSVQSNEVFVVIGCGWLAAALVRFISLFLGYYSPTNLGGVIFEAIIGLLCVSAFIT